MILDDSERADLLPGPREIRSNSTSKALRLAMETGRTRVTVTHEKPADGCGRPGD